MPRISRDDYRALELKVQTEIQKVFSQFMDDLENKAVEEDKKGTLPGQRTPVRQQKSVPEGTVALPVKPRKPRVSKRTIEVGKILNCAARPGTDSPRKTLEEDMDKIFRKKHRRGSR